MNHVTNFDILIKRMFFSQEKRKVSCIIRFDYAIYLELCGLHCTLSRDDFAVNRILYHYDHYNSYHQYHYNHYYYYYKITTLES
jgi:hypothetical protein